MVLWKPSDTAILSNYTVYKIMREAGVPGEVVSFLPADGPVFGDAITASEHLAAINFTGSVPWVCVCVCVCERDFVCKKLISYMVSKNFRIVLEFFFF